MAPSVPTDPVPSGGPCKSNESGEHGDYRPDASKGWDPAATTTDTKCRAEIPCPGIRSVPPGHQSVDGTPAVRPVNGRAAPAGKPRRGTGVGGLEVGAAAGGERLREKSSGGPGVRSTSPLLRPRAGGRRHRPIRGSQAAPADRSSYGPTWVGPAEAPPALDRARSCPVSGAVGTPGRSSGNCARSPVPAPARTCDR